MPDHFHFVTGRLAEHALRTQLAALAPEVGFTYTIDVLPITVAALMSPTWVARHVRIPPEARRVILPGYCEGDLAPIEALAAATKVERGPHDLRQLPEFFGCSPRSDPRYGDFDIQILAEINHAPRLSRAEILRQARQLASDGADLIDVGCEPGDPWREVGDIVRMLRDEGLRVSIDSLQPEEIALAAQAGAELVLSVNSTNRAAAPDWGCEVVVIPDDFATLEGLDATVEFLASRDVRLRIDPILEPIGFGFAASLGRYLEVRRRYPDAEMLMGIGNLTELTDVDSAGVNALLLGFCQEVGIRGVLTTQVINWARTSVRECDLARRLMHFAVTQRVPPKHLEPALVTLRDPKLYPADPEQLDRLAADIRDPNYRLFAGEEALHLVSASLHLREEDPFRLFEQLLATNPRHLDASHAFYLGFEMCKAQIALTLGKTYTQDESLDWGYLTRAERSHRLKFRRER
jgi:dihydropteroate synthase-like protein